MSATVFPAASVTPKVHSYGTLPRVDYYDIDDMLTPGERDVRDRVRAFVDREVTPVITDYYERAEFPFFLIDKLKSLNLTGGPLMGYGCPGISFVASGLLAAEMSRGDGSLATFFGVHSGLAMGAIWLFGSDEQKKTWLPAMARLEKIGAFALTEPEHGSDSIGLESSARRAGDDWILNGRKRWIGNGTIADVIVFNARDEDGNVRSFLIEKGMPGFEATKMEGKMAKRAVWQADIVATDVRVPSGNVLPGVKGFKDIGKLLAATRYGVAWECVGHAMAAYECALAYSLERKQFRKPLASFQLVQSKLAHMLAEITSMQLLSIRLGQLAQKFRMTNGQCSLAKMNNAAKARQVVADARDLLGGNGVLYEYVVARHFLDMEIVYTYEGTDSIQTLIVGKDITGLQAFA
ncbi:MAG: acyl-CoA dehydrogenase family protein [Candidatus Eremiobacteraeota bacterium]|nr:acyl-CoA dehydrogenase family protein [Candidatus Eremiobacteraeota bacterium]